MQRLVCQIATLCFGAHLFPLLQAQLRFQPSDRGRHFNLKHTNHIQPGVPLGPHPTPSLRALHLQEEIGSKQSAKTVQEKSPKSTLSHCLTLRRFFRATSSLGQAQGESHASRPKVELVRSRLRHEGDESFPLDSLPAQKQLGLPPLSIRQIIQKTSLLETFDPFRACAQHTAAPQLALAHVASRRHNIVSYNSLAPVARCTPHTTHAAHATEPCTRTRGKLQRKI